MVDIRDAEVLITGGVGFIGSTLAQKILAAGARVTVLDSMIEPYGGNEFNLRDIVEKISFIKGDIRSRKDVEKAVNGKDIIYHLAGQTGRVISMQRPEFDYEMNVKGTLLLLDTLRKNNKEAKFIFTSSRGVIGDPISLPVDESHPTNPKDIYGAHKLVAEKYCSIYAWEYGIDVGIVRFNNIYGPRCQIKSNHYGTINLFIRYALEGKVLPIYGTGTQTRDYVYVDDAVSALICMLHPHAKNELFIIGSETETSLLSIAKIIKKSLPMTNYKLVPYPQELRKIDFNRFITSSQKAKDMLGWSTKVNIEEGIKKTIEFYQKNISYYT